jgi:spermidine/putrescine transport system ATP-binding protein
VQQSLVEIDAVTKQFGDFKAVRDLDLGIESGEFLAIMGSSGCGKTTTLRMLAGLDAPSEGEIRLSGERINELKTWERDTPLVWQNLALFPFLSVIENVEFGLRMRGVGRQERNRRAMDWLERLGIDEFASRNIAQLSGGQRQRVALARSLVTEPPILLLDEPLSALDANLKIRMQAVLTELQKEVGITFVYVTHSHSEAFAMADRVVFMSEGLVEQVGTPETIYNRPRNRFVAEFIGGKNIIAGQVTERSDSGSVLVESSHGTFRVGPKEEKISAAEPGAEVTLCVGADRIDFADATDNAENQLACRIVSEEFVGSMVTVYLETDSGLELQVQRPYVEWSGSRLKKGGNVRVSWEADAARLLDSD